MSQKWFRFFHNGECIAYVRDAIEAGRMITGEYVVKLGRVTVWEGETLERQKLGDDEYLFMRDSWDRLGQLLMERAGL